MNKHFKPALIIFTALMVLSACASGVQEDGPAVKTAKACQRAKESNPGILEGFKITACTNTGIWMIDEYDAQGSLVKRFDFVNHEYAGPESQGIFMPVEALGPEAPGRMLSIQQTLNSKLLNPKS